MENKTISIVIPAYNEESRIASTIRDIKGTVENLKEIIVVFDGSDRTPEIVESICPDCKVIQHNHRLGKGKAVKEGIEKATGDIIAYVDADGSIPASEVNRLSSMLTDRNFVVSSRWMRSSRIKVKQPGYRILFGRVFHYFVFFLFRMDIKDTQCGLKVFRSKSLKEIIQRVRVFDWAFDVSVIYHAMEYGLKPVEVGIEWNNQHGSKLRVFKTIPKMFLSVFGMWIINKHYKSSKIKTIIDKIESEFFSRNI